MMAMDSMRIATGIVAGLLDVGITQFEITEPQVRREKLQSVEAVCVLHPSHRLARRSTIKPKDLQDEPFISLAATDRFRLKLDSLLRAEDISRRMQIETPLANAACAFVMQGMGIAMIDRLSAEDNLYRGIVIKRFSPSIAEGLFLLSPTRRQMSLVAETLAEAIRSRFRTL
jgi:DNA-binding transcriptional LysR family regulator